MSFHVRTQRYYGHVLVNDERHIVMGFEDEDDEDHPYPVVLTKADAITEFVNLGIEVGR